jgi:hypothetical protein
MNKIVIFIVICFSLSKLQAQIISPEIITSGGDFYSNSTAMLSFSEGVVIEESFLPSANSIHNTGIVPDPIKIYPNPATTNLTIETLQKSEIGILNIEGQLIKCIGADENHTDIDISAFPVGMYIVKVTTEKGIAAKKFVKE